MNKQYILQIGDIIEEFNCTGSSDRKCIKTYEITSVTKTLAKTDGGWRFNRTAELWGNEMSVRMLDRNKYSVLAHRLCNKS